MIKPAWMQKTWDYVASRYGEDVGKMLVHTGVIGWVLSSAAQVTAILINEKIPKEQKMYMVPQELADAAVNIVSFYAVTRTFKAVANKLVSTGKLLPKTIRNVLKNSSVAEEIGKKGFDVAKHGHLSTELLNEYGKFYSGIDILGTTLGSVISCNLLTPVIRNEIAASRQKKGIAKINSKSDGSPANIKAPNSKTAYFKAPTMQTFQASSMNKPYSGNLKV